MQNNVGLVITLMPDEHSEGTYHVFLLDLVTENYKFIRTLTGMSKEEARVFAIKIANHSPQELTEDTKKIGEWIDSELKKSDA